MAVSAQLCRDGKRLLLLKDMTSQRCAADGDAQLLIVLNVWRNHGTMGFLWILSILDNPAKIITDKDGRFLHVANSTSHSMAKS